MPPTRKPGTSRLQITSPHPPTSTNISVFAGEPRSDYHQNLGLRWLNGATSASAAQSDRAMPSPGRQASGMAGHKNRCGWAWAAGWGIPPTSPGATTRQPRSRDTRCTHRFRRELLLGCRVVGLRQADGMPHKPNVTLRNRTPSSPFPIERHVRRTAGYVVVSSLVSSVYVRLRSSVFESIRRHRSRT
jgi:hypothetical protein